MNTEFDGDKGDECYVDAVSECLDLSPRIRLKNLRKKKKHKNYRWNTKKVNDKVKVGTPSLIINAEDTFISDNDIRSWNSLYGDFCLYKCEAIKTVEVDKLLDLSFCS